MLFWKWVSISTLCEQSGIRKDHLSEVWISPFGPLYLLFPPMQDYPQQARTELIGPQNIGARIYHFIILSLASPKHSSVSQEMTWPWGTPISWYLAWTWQRALPHPEYVVTDWQCLTWPWQWVTACWVQAGNWHYKPWIVCTSLVFKPKQQVGLQKQLHWLSSSWNCGCFHCGLAEPAVAYYTTTIGTGAIIIFLFLKFINNLL